jgi:hypothetical protein
MFRHFRDEHGNGSLLAAAVALLALSVLLSPLLFRSILGLLISVAMVTASLVLGTVWWLRRRRDQYDLKRLWETPPPELEEPPLDVLPLGEEGSPYCGWCDEAYPPHTHRCRHCGRRLR